MKSKVRMEGLTLTVKNVERSIKYYQNIGFDCEWNAAPHFAMLRIGGKGGPTVGLLAWSVAKKKKIMAAYLISICRGVTDRRRLEEYWQLAQPFFKDPKVLSLFCSKYPQK